MGEDLATAVGRRMAAEQREALVVANPLANQQCLSEWGEGRTVERMPPLERVWALKAWNQPVRNTSAKIV